MTHLSSHRFSPLPHCSEKDRYEFNPFLDEEELDYDENMEEVASSGGGEGAESDREPAGDSEEEKDDSDGEF